MHKAENVVARSMIGKSNNLHVVHNLRDQLGLDVNLFIRTLSSSLSS